MSPPISSNIPFAAGNFPSPHAASTPSFFTTLLDSLPPLPEFNFTTSTVANLAQQHFNQPPSHDPHSFPMAAESFAFHGHTVTSSSPSSSESSLPFMSSASPSVSISNSSSQSMSVSFDLPPTLTILETSRTSPSISFSNLGILPSDSSNGTTLGNAPTTTQAISTFPDILLSTLRPNLPVQDQCTQSQNANELEPQNHPQFPLIFDSFQSHQTLRQLHQSSSLTSNPSQLAVSSERLNEATGLDGLPNETTRIAISPSSSHPLPSSTSSTSRPSKFSHLTVSSGRLDEATGLLDGLPDLPTATAIGSSASKEWVTVINAMTNLGVPKPVALSNCMVMATAVKKFIDCKRKYSSFSIKDLESMAWERLQQSFKPDIWDLTIQNAVKNLIHEKLCALFSKMSKTAPSSLPTGEEATNSNTENAMNFQAVEPSTTASLSQSSSTHKKKRKAPTANPENLTRPTKKNKPDQDADS